MPEKVLVVAPQDFREEARARFREAQSRDLMNFCAAIKALGDEAILLEEGLVEPNQAYQAVKAAIREHNPTRIIMRCYLWADPPNGHAALLAAENIPVAASAYSAPPDEPLGEAPGEVFVLHTSCAARMCGQPITRLFGPLSGDGSERTMSDLREFIETGCLAVAAPADPETVLGKDIIAWKSDTALGEGLLKVLRGQLVATTGGPAMGMLPCSVTHPWHCATNAWGLNIPIVSPDLFDWHRRFEEKRNLYLDLGRAYVRWLERNGVQFYYQHDQHGDPMPPNERDYTPEVAAFQMGLYAAMVDLAEERKISILGIPAQLLMTDHVVCGDLIKGVAMSSEGPEGRRRRPLFWMTEGDIDAGISHYLLHAVTGSPPVFADVRCTIPALGTNVWKMCNSGAACMDIAKYGWTSCYSVRQYSGYFRVAGGGGTFAFLETRNCHVVGLRVALDQQGPYGVVAIGRTRQGRPYVDARWPQLNVEVAADEWETRQLWPTNHFHWALSSNPIAHARALVATLRLVCGDRVALLYDGRPFSEWPVVMP